MDVMTERCQCATERMNRADRTAVSKRGQIRWYDVKKAQVLVHKFNGRSAFAWACGAAASNSIGSGQMALPA
ncbi:MAG: hypothetical protein A3D94_14675 [Alphaproteobacteria bacterium RIFCSPHIGHO2_12_FULL_66_14]|nr:MAG: hypothetical protein A3D94_14675 [Alphaproteobacteria bacterium RIFCSPHIGHO2_12_FULL_66_14]